MWHRWDLEKLVGCLHPGAIGFVVASMSVLGARESFVGECPCEGRSDTGLETGEAVAGNHLEVLVGLEFLDNVLCLGVCDDELEADEVVVQASICGAYCWEEEVALGQWDSYAWPWCLTLLILVPDGGVLLVAGVTICHNLFIRQPLRYTTFAVFTAQLIVRSAPHSKP